MDSSMREQGSATQQAPKSLVASLRFLVNTVQWLTSLIELTEEEQEDAGIYLGRLGGE